jgi:hypothetical protein
MDSYPRARFLQRILVGFVVALAIDIVVCLLSVYAQAVIQLPEDLPANERIVMMNNFVSARDAVLIVGGLAMVILFLAIVIIIDEIRKNLPEGQ